MNLSDRKENIQEQNDHVNQVEKEQLKENEELKDIGENEKELTENEENIAEQLGEYYEEQNNKIHQKIKVYNIVDNKNLKSIETNDSDSLVVFLSSSVKMSKNKIENYDENNDSDEDNTDNDEIGPKNSIRKMTLN